MEVSEVILAHGHENVQATHRTTLEITKAPHLSKGGKILQGFGGGGENLVNR